MNRRVLKTKTFARWMKKTELTDDSLCTAIDEMQQGLIDADLGGNLYKKRVGIANRGKRGGVRTILATNLGSRWFFMFGYEKSDLENLSSEDKTVALGLAKIFIGLSEDELNRYLQLDKLEEICT